jgi:nucleoside-diphosphate-sugar epimerase
MPRNKVLVTGAPGWLGTRFVEILVKNNREVRCLVLKNIDYSYLKKLGAETYEGDITKPETLEKVTEDIDTVFHIAGIIHPKFFRGVKDFYKINTQGTKNLLEASIKAGVKRFIYISSNSAVGVNSDKNVLMNEYTIPKPYLNYGKSKLLAEKIVNEAFVKGEIETTIIRPCWFYGPGQPERQTRLMKMIKKGKVPLFGDGKNLRSMTYIDNLCQALLLAEKSKIAIGETYWIADERPYTTLEIYQTIADILGVELKVRKIPSFVSSVMRIGDKILQRFGFYQQEVHVAGEMTLNIACSIEKAKKDLDYKPKIGLKEGMRLSIEWAKSKGFI